MLVKRLENEFGLGVEIFSTRERGHEILYQFKIGPVKEEVAEAAMEYLQTGDDEAFIKAEHTHLYNPVEKLLIDAYDIAKGVTLVELIFGNSALERVDADWNLIYEVGCVTCCAVSANRYR